LADYTVTNAGTSAANQDYTQSGTDGNGRPIYTGDTNSYIKLQHGVSQATFSEAWVIEDTSIGDQLYYSSDSTASLPPEETYSPWLGAPPGADVAAADGDTTAPTLSNASATNIGNTTVDGQVDTDEGNGTLYGVVTAGSANPSQDDHTGSADVDSASTTVSSAGTQTLSFSGLTAATNHYIHFVHEDSAGNQSNVVSTSQFTTTGGDTTAPTLSNASATNIGNTTVDGQADTDEGNGTLFGVVTASSTKPSKAEVKAGQDYTGSAAVDSAFTTVSSTGTQTLSFSGLTAATNHYIHFMHEDSAGNQSSVVSTSQFTTTGGDTTADVKGNSTSITDGDSTPETGDDTDFGTIDNDTTKTHTFTIHNTGSGDLTLSGSPKVAISGSSAFSVSAQPSSPVTPSGSTTFDVQFDPSGSNLTDATATLSIANDDSDENPYTFDVKGSSVASTSGNLKHALVGFNDFQSNLATSEIAGLNAFTTAGKG